MNAALEGDFKPCFIVTMPMMNSDTGIKISIIVSASRLCWNAVKSPVNNGLPHITIYCQSLHGVGHYVRAKILADALASIASVTIINGGRSCRKIGKPPAAALLEMPGIFRDPATQALRHEEPGVSWEENLRLRRECFEKHFAGNSQAVLIVDYFPFQRWESAEEILALIRLAKETNRHAKIICSVRDFPRPVANASERRRVVEALNTLFDYLLIHGDPAVCASWKAFDILSEVTIPVLYTGYLSRAPDIEQIPVDTDFCHNVVVSSGGGSDSREMLLLCIEAWRRIAAAKKDGGRRMSVFAGAYLSAPDQQAIEAAAARVSGVRLMPFSDAFPGILRQADLSISCAGINTCTDVMKAGVRAIFIPSEAVSDQCERARRMEALGVGRAILPDDFEVDFLQYAIVEAFHSKPAAATVALDGAEVTTRFMERILKDSVQ